MDRDRLVDRRTVLSGVGAGVLVLAGCAGDEGDGAESDGGDGAEGDGDGAGTGEDGEEPVEGDQAAGAIEVTGVWSGAEEADFMAVVDYVQQETAVDVSYRSQTTDSLLSGTLMDYESGTAPADIVVMPSPARIRTDATAGHLEAVGDVWDPADYAADPDRVTVDGEVYAAPFKMDIKPGFWYRQSFFEEHDLTEPGSDKEFRALLEEIDGIEGVNAPLAAGNGTGWPLSDLTEAFILRQDDGAALQRNLVTGDAEFTDERVRTALSEVQELIRAGYFGELRDFGVQYEYFWDNSLPLYFMGSWTPTMEAIQDPSDLDFFRLPGTESVVASVNWLTVPTYSENVDAARTALAAFVSAEGQQVWAERGGFVPSSTAVPQDAYEHQIMADLVAVANEIELVPDLDDSLGNPFQEEFWSQLTGLWTNPEADIDSAIDSLAEAHAETVAA